MEATAIANTAAPVDDMQEEVAAYLRHIRIRLATETLKSQRIFLNAFVRYCELRKMHLRTVHRQDVEEYLLSLNGGLFYRHIVCRTLHDFYAFIQPENNPAEGIEIKRPPRPLMRVPGINEMEKIVTLVNGWNELLTLRNQLMVELAYGSGMRRSELMKLDITDINHVDKTAYIHGKGDKARTVPLTQKSLRMIEKYCTMRKATSGPLLVNFWNERWLGPGAISKIFKMHSGLNTHLFRHACASHMLANGCDIRAIQALLGHTDITTTTTYTHINKSALRQVITLRHPRNKTAFKPFLR
jgi:site-specific recombinase XerD